MGNPTKRVKISTAPVGQAFGTTGVIRHASNGRRIEADLLVRPYGFDDAAKRDAEAYATAQGWTVVS